MNSFLARASASDGVRVVARASPPRCSAWHADRVPVATSAQRAPDPRGRLRRDPVLEQTR